MSLEPCKVFISYSHEDDALCQELVKHLALLQRQGKVEAWHDRRIAAGDEWRGQIDAELEAADVVLLLVSASFIASDYCWDVEATRALERHSLGEARVIPIIVRSCHWEDAPFAKLQALPAGGKPVMAWPDRDEAWSDVVHGLREAIAASGKVVGQGEEVAAGLGMRFRMVAPGTFLMGSPEDEWGHYDDERQHEVTLTRGFWMAETAVTQEEWQMLTGNNPARFKGNGRRPVEQVSWFDAVAFANLLSERAGFAACYELVGGNGRAPGDRFKCDEVRLIGLNLPGYRLPTEAEWEYAARAGTTTPFSTGRDLTTEQANYEGNYPYAGNKKGIYRHMPVPVRSFAPNPWGLYEVHGNLWEWVWDWYDAYPSESVTDPCNPEWVWGSPRVVRGGCWNLSASFCRSARRHDRMPGHFFDELGIRLVRSA